MAHGYYNLKGEWVGTGTKAEATTAWRAERGYSTGGVYDVGGGETVDTGGVTTTAPPPTATTAPPGDSFTAGRYSPSGISQRKYTLSQFGTPNVPAVPAVTSPVVPSSNAQYIMSQYNKTQQQPQYAIHQELNTGSVIPQQQLWSNPNYNPDIHGSWGETEAKAPGSIDLMQLSSLGLSYYGKGGWAGHLPPGIGEEQAGKILSGEYSEGYPLSAWDFLNEWPYDEVGSGIAGDGSGGGGYGGYGGYSGPGGSIASSYPRYSNWGLVMWRIG